MIQRQKLIPNIQTQKKHKYKQTLAGSLEKVYMIVSLSSNLAVRDFQILNKNIKRVLRTQLRSQKSR